MSDEAWLSISEFLTARELGQVGRCSSDLRVISLDPWVWKLLFYRVWLRSDPRSHLGRVPRPKGADAIGWKIRVFSEEWRRWNEARIIGMRQVGDKVQWQLKYPGGDQGEIEGGDVSTVRWEVDQRSSGPWHERGRSRFIFLEPSFDISNLDNASTGSQISDTSDGRGGIGKTGMNVESMEHEEIGIASHEPTEKLQQSINWLREYRKHVEEIPAKELCSLNDVHSDEVLDLCFSHNGYFLASCSRDLRTHIYAVEYDHNITASAASSLSQSYSASSLPPIRIKIIHSFKRPPRTACVCRLAFSPDDKLLLTCIEDPHGNPFGWRSCIEIWYVETGAFLGSAPSTPFDVHGNWLPLTSTNNTHYFVCGEGISPIHNHPGWLVPPDDTTSDAENDPRSNEHRRVPTIAQYISVWGVKVPYSDGSDAASIEDRVSSIAASTTTSTEPNADDDDNDDGYDSDSNHASISTTNLVARVECVFFGRNFAHLAYVSKSGRWLAFATGDNSQLVHRVHIMDHFSNRVDQVILRDQEHRESSESEDNFDEPPALLVHALPSGVTSLSAETQGSASQIPEPEVLPAVECSGAVLSISITKDDRYLLVNVRPFLEASVRSQSPSRSSLADSDTVPDISNECVLQVWSLISRELVAELAGHRGFTTKECPFLIFTDQSGGFDSCGIAYDQATAVAMHEGAKKHGNASYCDINEEQQQSPFAEISRTKLNSKKYVKHLSNDFFCSGSEDSRLYIWNLQFKKLVRVLSGHTDVVSACSWHPWVPGVLVSASDDHTIRIWGRRVQTASIVHTREETTSSLPEPPIIDELQYAPQSAPAQLLPDGP